MMRRFRDLPIRRKLALLLLGSNAIALLALFAAMAGYQLVVFRDELGERFRVTADMVAANSAAALAFRDARAARDVLDALRAEQNVVCAHALTADGAVLGSFRACPDWTPGAPEPPRFRLFEATRDELVQVYLEPDHVGAVHVRFSLAAWHAQLRNSLALFCVSLAFAFVAALFLSAVFQRAVAGPIVHLFEMMRRVSSQRDYSLRARPQGRDEVGALMEEFNGMLGEIEDRDARLRRQNEGLEAEVSRRTEELRTTAAAAESAARAKSEFLATMSHEIRTPLNGVIGMAELLKATELSVQQRDFVETIHHSADMLMAVINDVLDFSKIEAGEMRLERWPIDLHHCLHAAVDLVTPQATAKGLRVECHIAPEVPPLVIGDATRVSQVVVNLLNNAVKFTDAGRVELRATAGRRHDVCEVSITVADTGIGMTPEQQQRLFQPFCQGDASITRRFGGTGLGLVICKRLLTAMNGTIVARSTPGAGTVFEVTLPMELARGAAPAAAPAPEVPEPTGANSWKVLLVEDYEFNQKALLLMLQRLGHYAEIADNGAVALERLQGADYDLVLMDMQMPVMDGLEATRRIRQLSVGRPQPYIVAMTANALQGDRERCLAAGMDDYLSKPVRSKDLAAALSRFAQRRKDSGALAAG